MRADHRGHAAVEPSRHGDLLARRLGVEVDDDRLRLLTRLGNERVDLLERIDRRVEEERADHVDHGDAVDHGEPASGRVARHVRRPDHPLALLEVRADPVAPPNVVPERDHVGSRGEQLVGELRRDPRPVGDVLAVQDAEVRAELCAQPVQPLLDRTTPGRAEHVGDEKNLQFSESVAAG